MNARVILSCAFLAAAWAGCETLEPGPDHGDLPADQIVTRYLAWERSVKTLEGEARVEIDSPQREGSLKATVLVRKPHRFRMVAYPPVGGTVFDLTIVRRSLKFHIPSEKKLVLSEIGAPGPKAKKEESDLNVIFAQAGLASLILGRLEDTAPGRFKLLDRTSKVVTFGVFDENGWKTEEIQIQERTLFKLRHRTFGRGGRVALDVRYDRFRKRKTGDIWWPSFISIHCPSRSFKLTLDFNDVELNCAIPNETFNLEVPEGTEIIEK